MKHSVVAQQYYFVTNYQVCITITSTLTKTMLPSFKNLQGYHVRYEIVITHNEVKLADQKPNSNRNSIYAFP